MSRPGKFNHLYHTLIAEQSNISFFFFQAEDGIRDRDVTGVQTCALPIYFLDNLSNWWKTKRNKIINCEALPFTGGWFLYLGDRKSVV